MFIGTSSHRGKQGSPDEAHRAKSGPGTALRQVVSPQVRSHTVRITLQGTD
jgi:hypothetical protein